MSTLKTSVLEHSALLASGPIVLALQECSAELRTEAIGLFEDLHSGELDAYQTRATLALLAEILFPNADAAGLPGLDLEEIEQLAPSQNPEASGVLEEMDREEATFADHLQRFMAERQLTQVQLAGMVGLGQPAISMMLNRTCRPQKKTIRRFAEALDVAPTDLWPAFRD